MNLWKKKRVYLDSAAAAQVSRRALQAFERASGVFANPSSPHTEGREAHDLLEVARAQIATLAEVKADAVIFTGTATEANAIAIEGYVRALHTTSRAYADMHVLYAPGAHTSLVHTVEQLKSLGVSVEPLAYKQGEVDLEALAKQVNQNTVLVSVSAVCGETGAITPMRDVRRVIDSVRKIISTEIILHVDASQLPRVGAFELTRLGADMLVLDAQKVGGVRGVGALVAPRRVKLSALMHGGGQERLLRPGTPSPALATAFTEALVEAHQTRAAFTAHSLTLRTQLLRDIGSLSNIKVNEGKQQAPHICNISLIGRDTDYLVALLDEAGFAVSTRSACETDEEGSRAVLVMTNDPERACSTLRVSWGPETSQKDIAAFSRALIASVKFLDTAGIL